MFSYDILFSIALPKPYKSIFEISRDLESPKIYKIPPLEQNIDFMAALVNLWVYQS